MKPLLLCFILCLGLVACNKDNGAAPADVSIRVRNSSPYAFDTILVNTTGGEQTYGSLGTGQSSIYQSFTKAYRYAYLRIVVQGQELVWQPIDYVGEQPLTPGQYTYVVDVVDVGGTKRLSLTFEKP